MDFDLPLLRVIPFELGVCDVFLLLVDVFNVVDVLGFALNAVVLVVIIFVVWVFSCD